jgi:hypothetical protein
MAFPIVTGICLGLFMTQYYAALAKGMTLVQANIVSFSPYWALSLIGIIICAIFLKDFPEQVGAYRDNDKSFTAEMANQMLAAELEARKKSVWKRSKIWGCKDWWLMAIPTLFCSCAIAFMVQIIPVLCSPTMIALSVLAVPGSLLLYE